MRVLGGGPGALGGPGRQRRAALGARTGRGPATRNRAGDPPDPAFARATTAAAAVVVVAGTLGTLWLRGWGRVGFEVPSVPWYFCFPFYVFPHPRLALGWAAAAVPVMVAAAVAVLALYRAPVAWPWRVAASAGLAAVLALAVAALAGGPAAWGAPFDYAGEYPAGVDKVGAIPTFLRVFPARLPDLPSHATGHPAGAMVVYALVARVWPGLTAAALATVALGSLGAIAAGGLARDELGERGGRLALAAWVAAPGMVLYLATSADAVFAAVLGGAALAAHRGLVRRSAAWTVAGGVLLWASSMLTYAAVLLLVFLGVRAAGLLHTDRATVLRWAAGTGAVVVGLAAGLWLAAGYDVPDAVVAVHGAYQAAPGSAGRSLVQWLPGDLLAFGGMLGVPLLAALATRAVAVVRERAWASVDAAVLATLLAAASWGFTKGEVERIFQFLIPLVLVPVVRQLLVWRARAPVVVGLLIVQTLLVQVLFATRW
jgi:methylthioxylose transferase